MTPGSTRKKGGGWGRGAAKKSRLSTAECTSIVDGLKLIYFSKVLEWMPLTPSASAAEQSTWCGNRKPLQALEERSDARAHLCHLPFAAEPPQPPVNVAQEHGRIVAGLQGVCIECLALSTFTRLAAWFLEEQRIICPAQIRPLEEVYKFGAFFSSYLNESDFYAKPSVLLLGQYSTGARARTRQNRLILE